MLVTINPHYRKRRGRIIRVRAYTRKQLSNRGNPTNIRRRYGEKKTYWLKGSRGRFVGRANPEGKTRAKGIIIRRLDNTGVRADERTERIYGRSPIRE